MFGINREIRSLRQDIKMHEDSLKEIALQLHKIREAHERLLKHLGLREITPPPEPPAQPKLITEEEYQARPKEKPMTESYLKYAAAAQRAAQTGYPYEQPSHFVYPYRGLNDPFDFFK